VSLPQLKHPGYTIEDWTSKRWACEAAGVPEYLVVDPDERVGVLLRLEAGHYLEAVRVAWGAVVELLGGKFTVTLRD
jgi:Uma2 family endonuclease